MKKCRDIENLLPLYREGILSDEEKRAVEEHLADCAQCRKELAYLQKASELVDGLSDVEEPPWFQQKIMAQVREEARKKSPAQKWFYPLRIKIPVQIMATLVIAILAVYIYRSGDEQVKEILPGVRQPAVEMQREQTPAPLPQAGKQAAPVVPRKKPAAGKEAKYDKQAADEIAVGGDTLKSVVPESQPGIAYQADAYRAKGLAENMEEAGNALPDQQNELQSVRVQVKEQEKKAEDRLSIGMAKKRESYKMTAPAALPSMTASATAPTQAGVFLRVDELNSAVSEVEKVLVRYKAKNVMKRVADGRVIINAEVTGPVWKEVLSKLKGIGQVEEKNMPANIGEGNVHVLIEISGQ